MSNIDRSDDPPSASGDLVRRSENLPTKISTERLLGVRPSRFAFINRANQQRIQAFTGVVKAATELAGAQTELRKAAARLENVAQEIHREALAVELENVRLENQIAEERRKQRLAALQEQRERLTLENDIRTLSAPQSAQPERATPAEKRQQLLREIDDLHAEMEQVLIQITQGQSEEDLTPDLQERCARIRNTYETLMHHKLDGLERSE